LFIYFFILNLFFKIIFFTQPYLEGIVYSRGDLDSRIEKIAWEIAEFYKEESYTMLVLMKVYFKKN
jgi:hypothetical protein